MNCQLCAKKIQKQKVHLCAKCKVAIEIEHKNLMREVKKNRIPKVLSDTDIDYSYSKD